MAAHLGRKKGKRSGGLVHPPIDNRNLRSVSSDDEANSAVLATFPENDQNGGTLYAFSLPVNHGGAGRK
jgi:hypothetical protein